MKFVLEDDKVCLGFCVLVFIMSIVVIWFKNKEFELMVVVVKMIDYYKLYGVMGIKDDFLLVNFYMGF